MTAPRLAQVYGVAVDVVRPAGVDRPVCVPRLAGWEATFSFSLRP